MADFRRWVTALAVLALFAGLASAQINTGGTGAGSQMVCNSVAQVTPTLRSEGITELVGDIVITCTGGTSIPNGQQIPQANLIVSLTAPVTSRLVSSGGSTGTSEALLLIDEPNSGLAPQVPGFGPNAPLKVCTSTSGGCIEYASTSTTGTTGIPIAVDSTGAATYNVFMGVVNGNQVSFNGIPILPPVSTGSGRVYRITNIRVNASGAGSSVVSGVQPVYAYLSTAFGSLPVSNAALTVGFVQTSLTPSVTIPKSDNSGATTTTAATTTNVPLVTQCVAVTKQPQVSLNFAENFPSAFKTRVGINPATGQYTSPLTTTGGVNASYLGTSGSGAGYTQNVPGTLYSSESGFILNAGTLPNSSTPFVAGLADSGTRFQAVFANVPAGTRIFVSRTNITNFSTAATSAAGNGVAAAAGTVQPSLALFTSGSGVFTDPTAPSGGFATSGNVDLVELTVSGGAATAQWEVVNTNSAGLETFRFGLYVTTTPNLTNNAPTPGSAGTVTLSYSPIGTGSLPASPNWIPRFIVGAGSTAQPFLNIVKCNTVLLFPYITSAAGFDTGIAISNTSADPISGATPTTQSSGSCTMSFYGANAPTGTIAPLGPIPAGNGSDPTKFAFMLSTVAPNFTGYMFAVCDFQFAHGFAFISDVGTRNLAMGYLALVVNNGSITRGSAAEALNQ